MITAILYLLLYIVLAVIVFEILFYIITLVFGEWLTPRIRGLAYAVLLICVLIYAIQKFNGLP